MPAISAAQLQAAADVTGVNLSGNNLSSFDLSGLNLNSANLSSANLTNASLVGTNFSLADLAGANLHLANLPASLPMLPVVSGATVQVIDSLAVVGAMTVDAGGLLTISGPQPISAASASNSGTINLVGASVDFGAGGLTNDVALALIDSSITGTVVSPADSAINVIGTVTFNDLVSGAGGIFGSGTAIFNGGHSPGDSPAVMSVESDLVYSGTNTLTIELAGLLTGEFDRVEIGGNATLGGLLDVSLLGGFTLIPGLSFEIINVGGSLSGTFLDQVEGGLVGNFGGINLLITYAGGDGNDVTLLTALPGDFDIDGDVNGFDFLQWQRGFGTIYDGNDLADWKANFGNVTPLTASSTTVPEPSTGILLVLGMVTMLVGRRAAVSKLNSA